LQEEKVLQLLETVMFFLVLMERGDHGTIYQAPGKIILEQ